MRDPAGRAGAPSPPGQSPRASTRRRGWQNDAVRFFDRSRRSRRLVQALDTAAVIAFDWDGTLLDSIDRTRATYRVIFQELGIAFDDELFRRHYSPDWRRMYDRLHVDRDLWPHIDRRWIEIYESEVSGLVPGVAESLQLLHRLGKRLALVTAGHRSRVEMELRANDLVGVFDTAVYGNEVPHQKPDPAPMLLASRYLRVDPGEILLVGDAPEDMTMAKRAGSVPVAVLTGASSPGSLKRGGARWVVTNVPALVGLLDPGAARGVDVEAGRA